MYATENIRKFLEDQGVKGVKKDEIMARCQEYQEDDIIDQKDLAQIFGDEKLTSIFHPSFIGDSEHLRIFLEIFRKELPTIPIQK